MNYPYNRHIIYKILCKWTCQTCFSGELLKAPWPLVLKKKSRVRLQIFLTEVCQNHFQSSDQTFCASETRETFNFQSHQQLMNVRNGQQLWHKQIYFLISQEHDPLHFYWISLLQHIYREHYLLRN